MARTPEVGPPSLANNDKLPSMGRKPDCIDSYRLGAKRQATLRCWKDATLSALARPPFCTPGLSSTRDTGVLPTDAVLLHIVVNDRYRRQLYVDHCSGRGIFRKPPS